MIIEYKNYKMESSTDGGFNLTRRVTRNKWDENRQPTGETYEEDEIVGYNMQLTSCIKKIIHLNHCSMDDKVQLHEYIKMYNSYVQEIKNLIKL